MKQYETLSLPFTCVKGFFTILEKKEERCMIDLRNVEKTYYSNAGDIHALKKTNLHINAGEIFGIIGLSGAGKSTLIRCINMLEVPTGGQVFVDGQELTAMNNQELRKARQNIGMIFQHFNLLASRTVYDNIAYGCRIHGIRNRKKLNMIVRHYLQAVGLWEEVKDRLHTPAGRMSIGQQQRLCLARGLAVEPQFILADEATSALDPISSKTIEDLFLKLKEEYAIVLVTHTLRQALRIADYVIFMYMGEIIEAGPAEQIFKNPQKELTQKYLAGVFS